MHSDLHQELYRAEAADRIRQAQRVASKRRRQHPPPWRERAARDIARLAGRLDRESARRAVA